MNIEVNLNNVWYPVNVIRKDEATGNVQVAFPSKWRDDQTVKVDQCRAVRSIKNEELQAGEQVEAYGVCGLIGWQKSTIKNKKNELYIVETVDKQTDAVEKKHLRSSKTVYIPFSKVDMLQLDINVGEDLCDYFSRQENIQDFMNVVGKIHADYDQSKRILHVSTVDPTALHRTQMIQEMYFKDAKVKESLRQKKEEISRIVNNSHNHSDSDFLEEFNVPQDLMGLAIGTNGVNIQQARRIEGVTDILVEESRGETPATIKVFAESPDAAQKARDILEYGTDTVDVERFCVGKIIGKMGHTIQEIVDKSGVIRVQITGDEQADPVPFMFTGTKIAIDHAKFLVEFHIHQIKSMEHLREEVDDLQRQMYPRRFERNGNGNWRGGRGGRGRGGGFGFSDRERDNESPEEPTPRGQQGGFRGGYKNGRRVRDEEEEEPFPSTGGFSDTDGKGDDGDRGNRRGRGRGRGNFRSRGGQQR